MTHPLPRLLFLHLRLGAQSMAAVLVVRDVFSKPHVAAMLDVLALDLGFASVGVLHVRSDSPPPLSPPTLPHAHLAARAVRCGGRRMRHRMRGGPRPRLRARGMRGRGHAGAVLEVWGWG